MLTKLYIDNYLGFSACEMEFQPFTVLLGPNGSGKTSVLSVIDQLRAFVCQGLTLLDTEDLVGFAPPKSITRWDTRSDQVFALTANIESETFEYRLTVQHNSDRTKRRVLVEELKAGGDSLFLFDEDAVAHLYDDNGVERATMPFDWSQSSLGVIRSGRENRRLTKFRDWLRSIQLVRPNPGGMGSISRSSTELIAPSLSNYASWLRGHFEHGGTRLYEMLKELKQVVDGLIDLTTVPSGDARRLEVLMEAGVSDQNHPYTVAFDELSDGQRLLIALYSLILLRDGSSGLLMLDEPDNYLALREIQPWLNRLQELIDDRGGQAILVSHHPEILDQAAADSGMWLSRPGNGPVRVRPFKEIADRFDGSAPSSEIIARGWTTE